MTSRAFQLTALRYRVERAIRGELHRLVPNAIRLFRLRRLNGLLRRRLRVIA